MTLGTEHERVARRRAHHRVALSLADGELRLGNYDATGPGGGPGALLAQTASFTPVVGWNMPNVTAPVSLPAGQYWLAYFPSSSNLQFATNLSIGSVWAT